MIIRQLLQRRAWIHQPSRPPKIVPSRTRGSSPLPPLSFPATTPSPRRSSTPPLNLHGPSFTHTIGQRNAQMQNDEGLYYQKGRDAHSRWTWSRRGWFNETTALRDRRCTVAADQITFESQDTSQRFEPSPFSTDIHSRIRRLYIYAQRTVVTS
ncbi:hypothetical protein FPV67DRAFT_116942 [Lyophyllum atratum]|nr:hypothetical protein FPV67DRAFT_116942 [Lyophyllum atratum]